MMEIKPLLLALLLGELSLQSVNSGRDKYSQRKPIQDSKFNLSTYFSTLHLSNSFEGLTKKYHYIIPKINLQSYKLQFEQRKTPVWRAPNQIEVRCSSRAVVIRSRMLAVEMLNIFRDGLIYLTVFLFFVFVHAKCALFTFEKQLSHSSVCIVFCKIITHRY